MKLLYVIHQYFPDCFSGTEQYCLASAREGRRRGDEVVVLSLVPDYVRDDPPLLLGEQPYDGFRVLRLRHWQALQPNDVLRDYENPLPACLFRQVLDDVQPDAVHFFHLRNLGSDLLDVARDAGVTTVVNLMDFWYLCPRFTLLRRDGSLCDGPPGGGLGCVDCCYPDLAGTWDDEEVGPLALAFARGLRGRLAGSGPAARFAALVTRKQRLLARLAAAGTVIAPSRFLAGMFERNGFPRGRLRVVPYGLEPGRVERREIARPRQPLRVAYAGVLSPWKSPHVVIDAVRQIDGPISLQVHGRTEEPMFRDYIAELRARAAGDPRISFPGPFDHDRLSDVMADTDVLVVPSTWYENTPFVILEAFEAGVPVIASDLGGMAEVIAEGENGFLFEAGDPASLATRLRRCLEDPSLLATMHPAPLGTIADNYDRFLEAYGRPAVAAAKDQ